MDRTETHEHEPGQCPNCGRTMCAGWCRNTSKQATS